MSHACYDEKKENNIKSLYFLSQSSIQKLIYGIETFVFLLFAIRYCIILKKKRKKFFRLCCGNFLFNIISIVCNRKISL